jgi:hypothetical protein
MLVSLKGVKAAAAGGLSVVLMAVTAALAAVVSQSVVVLAVVVAVLKMEILRCRTAVREIVQHLECRQPWRHQKQSAAAHSRVFTCTQPSSIQPHAVQQLWGFS